MHALTKKAVMTSLGLACGLIAFSTGNPTAHARPKPTECYKIKSDDVPYSIETPNQREEVWCYRDLERPLGSRLIYNIDEKGHTTPELTLMIGADGSITHGSLLGGKVTVHRVQTAKEQASAFNPLPVPLSPPKDAERVPAPISPSAVASSDEALNVLTTSDVHPQDITVNLEGDFNISVKPEAMPWRGYWFPHSSGRLHNGKNSPMAKYDRFVKARTGSNPGAQRWEQNNHRFTGINWAGHCNGWAAASVLRHEPREPWTDPFSGVTFTPNDIKGLLIERDYCPKMLFFGHRFNGRAKDNQRDIPANLFHNTMTYYIGQLGKPVLMDYMSGIPVENRVVSGYKMKIDKAGTNVYRVTMVAKVHSYDTRFEEGLGEANFVERTYKYKIWTDEAGNVTKGSWISSNPDFLWVPLSPAVCKDSNPNVTENWVEAINKPIGLPWK